MSRPIKFNRAEVVEKSMLLFWHQGYASTSIKQLGQQMDMRPGSIYAAFYNKRQLFIESLEFYFESGTRQLQKNLSLGKTPLECLRRYFSVLIDEITNECSIKGCFMINTANELAEHDAEIKSRLQHMFESHETQFYALLKQAQESGQLDDDLDAKAMARFLLMGVRGIRVYGQTDSSRENLRALVANLLSVLRVKH